jgi:hypothetical protein
MFQFDYIQLVSANFMFDVCNQTTLGVRGYCALECLLIILVRGIVPLGLLCCSAGNDLFERMNCQSNRFFPGAYISMCSSIMSRNNLKITFPMPISQWRRGGTYMVRGIKVHHGCCLTPTCGLLELLFAIIPHITHSFITHIFLCSSMNWILDDLHSMHHHPAIDSFPRAIAWKAKLPVMYMSTR